MSKNKNKNKKENAGRQHTIEDLMDKFNSNKGRAKDDKRMGRRTR